MSDALSFYNIRSSIFKLPASNVVYNIIAIVLIGMLSTMILLFLGTRDNGWFRRLLPGEECNFLTGMDERKCGIGLQCRENPNYDPNQVSSFEYTCQLPEDNAPNRDRCRAFCPICKP